MSSAIPEGLPPLQIHVLRPEDEEDVQLTDVGVVNINGERHLFLSPQSFGSAVRQVSAAMPDLPLEQVERLVREHCAEFKDFDELLGPIDPAPLVDVSPPPAEPLPARPRSRAKKWAIAALLLPAFAGTWGVGHFTGADPASKATSAPDSSPNSTDASGRRAGDKNLGPEPFTAHDFMDFSDAGKIDCNPIDNLEAECTDSDGMVMATKAATGPDSTIFMFSYGSERLGLRIFGDDAYAKTWALQDGSRELYPNLVRSGRYVLWGTDKARLKEYLGLLQSAPTKTQAANNLSHTMGAAEPLPPRLAALTLGTLGLDEQDVRTILFNPQDAPVEVPVLMAAQAVLGMSDATPPVMEPGAADIVALAAGIEPPPVVTEPGQNVQSNGGVIAVADPVEPSPRPTGGSSETPKEETAPSTNPAPDPKPVENEQTQKPVAEKPATPETPPVPTPEQPTTPDVPSTPDPTPPVTETPDPAPPVTETPGTESPDPGEVLPPAEGGGSTVEEPPATDEPTPVDGEDDQADEGGELLALPQAWIAPAA